LNRIICPDLGVGNFFKLAADVGIKKVEPRNDLPGTGIIDELSPARVRELADQCGIEIITINALQKFNLGCIRSQLIEELQQLIELAKSIRCRAIVFCPNIDARDTRNLDQIRKETPENLKSFASLFENGGMTGLVEPLCFPESPLDSLVAAMDIIRETEQPKEPYRDGHRVLVGPKDRLKSREQVDLLLEIGYSGDISFEPFSEEIQSLPVEELERVIKASVDYLCG